jgi:hypothetical protein
MSACPSEVSRLGEGGESIQCATSDDCPETQICVSSGDAKVCVTAGSNGGSTDAGAPGVDSGAPPADSGPAADAGNQPDSGGPPPDAGAAMDGGNASDSGIVTPDSGAGGSTDSGTPAQDAGGAPSDAGLNPDSGTSPGPDAGFDAGADAGANAGTDGGGGPSPDAGPPGDAGPPCIDLDGDLHGDNCAAGLDCDDNNPRRYFGLEESCDGIDNNCDSNADEGDTCPCIRRTNGNGLEPYLWCRISAGWEEAQNLCTRLEGYDLIKIIGNSERDWVTSTSISLGDDDWWIGLSDRVTEGVYQWTDSTVNVQDFYGNGQPDDWQGKEDCVEWHNATDAWNDQRCLEPNQGFICESNMRPVNTGPSCTDGDGDGRGDGCAQGPDCDDNDATRWRWYLGYPDMDLDGFSTNALEFICGGDPQPSYVLDNPTGSLDCDDENASETTTCSSGFRRYGHGREYRIFLGTNTWAGADVACAGQANNASLVILPSETDHSFFQRQLSGIDSGGDWWVGATDEAQDGTWLWADGSPVIYDGFTYNQPDGSGSENCAENWDAYVGWNDLSCGSSRRIACSIP